MKSVLAWIPIALVVVGLVGCKGNGNGNETAAVSPPVDAGGSVAALSAPTAASSAAAPLSSAARRSHRGGGIFGMLQRAARTLTLTDAQSKTLDSLDDELHGSDDRHGAGLETLDADVVAGIRAGKIDMAKVQADYAPIDAAMQTQLAKENAALNGLHAALGPAQRQQLVAGIRVRQAEHDEEAKESSDGGAPDLIKARVRRLAAEFGLDGDQQKQVTTLLVKSGAAAAQQARRDAADRRLDAILTAFTNEGFDASKIPPAGKSPHEGMESDVAQTAQLLAVLKPEQREKLALQRERMARLRAQMSAGGSGNSPWADDAVLEQALRQGSPIAPGSH